MGRAVTCWEHRRKFVLSISTPPASWPDLIRPSTRTRMAQKGASAVALSSAPAVFAWMPGPSPAHDAARALAGTVAGAMSSGRVESAAGRLAPAPMPAGPLAPRIHAHRRHSAAPAALRPALALSGAAFFHPIVTLICSREWRRRGGESMLVPTPPGSPAIHIDSPINDAARQRPSLPRVRQHRPFSRHGMVDFGVLAN